MEELKEKISEDIEKIQDKVDSIGFKGTNEYNLYLRHELIEYIFELQRTEIYNKLDEILHYVKT